MTGYYHWSMPREMVGPNKRARRKCECGNGEFAAYTGSAGGCALMSGCEWCVRQWAVQRGEA